MASHLKACLENLGIAPPYVLVGHSIGGLYALSYAKVFANDVAGLVLLDMRAPTFSEAAERHKPGSSRPPWYLTMLFPHHMKSNPWSRESRTAGCNS